MPIRRCECCGKAANGSIQVMSGTNNPPNRSIRYYLPSDTNRASAGVDFPIEELKELPLCPSCMRTVEDNFRATILYLQAENSHLAIRATSESEG